MRKCALLYIIALSLVLTGCRAPVGASRDGGESKARSLIEERDLVVVYYRAIISIQKIQDNTARALTNLSGKSDMNEFYSRIKASERVYDKTLVTFDELKPPPAFKAIHNKIGMSLRLRKKAAKSMAEYIETGSEKYRRQHERYSDLAETNMKIGIQRLKAKIKRLEIDVTKQEPAKTI